MFLLYESVEIRASECKINKTKKYYNVRVCTWSSWYWMSYNAQSFQLYICRYRFCRWRHSMNTQAHHNHCRTAISCVLFVCIYSYTISHINKHACSFSSYVVCLDWKQYVYVLHAKTRRFYLTAHFWTIVRHICWYDSDVAWHRCSLV